MSYEPFERLALGGTGLTITRLGFGAGSIAGLFTAVHADDAAAVVDRAWQLRIRYYDVAPLYGYGAGERPLGAGLAGRPRDEFVLSTKVGRLVRPAGAIPVDADVDRQAIKVVADAYFAETRGRRVIFDYSADPALDRRESRTTGRGPDRRAVHS